MERLDALTGTWRTTLDDAWFLEPDQQPVPGDATIEWLSDAFVVFRWTMGDVTPATSEMVVVIGRSDARADRIDGRWEASDDQGTTWRKDFDLVLERA